MINLKKRTKLVEKIDLDVKRISLHLEITYNPKPRKNIKGNSRKISHNYTQRNTNPKNYAKILEFWF